MGSNKKLNDHNYYIRHKEDHLRKSREWRLNHPYYMKEYMKTYYIKNKTKMIDNNIKWKEQNIEKVKSIKYNSFTKHRDKIYYRRRKGMLKARIALLNILGWSCVKCGYNEDFRALCFDHIRDDGKEDRKIHYNSYGFYRFYRDNPNLAKSNLQVLCCNCNNIKKYDNMGFSGLDY